MSYDISAGISEAELTEWLKNAADKFGVFKDGRVDYTHAGIAPIILCVIVCKDELLLLQRGFGLADAEGFWSVVTGFIDKTGSVKEQVKQEIKEELGLDINYKNMHLGESYTLRNSQEKRSYIIFPCRVPVAAKPKIILDHEHTDYAWVTRSQVTNYKILDDLPYAIDAALAA